MFKKKFVAIGSIDDAKSFFCTDCLMQIFPMTIFNYIKLGNLMKCNIIYILKNMVQARCMKCGKQVNVDNPKYTAKPNGAIQVSGMHNVCGTKISTFTSADKAPADVAAKARALKASRANKKSKSGRGSAKRSRKSHKSNKSRKSPSK